MSIFSDRFYQDPSFRGYKAFLDGETIALTYYSYLYSEFTFLDKIKSKFVFRPPLASLAVSQKMNQLFDEIHSPSSETAKKLAKEIYDKDKGEEFFKKNISIINDQFNYSENNKIHKSLLQFRLLLKIVNLFRRLFNYPPLALQYHHLIPDNQWNDKLDALQRVNAPFSIKITGNERRELNTERITQLQYNGESKKIFFTFCRKSYFLNYDKSIPCFKLQNVQMKGMHQYSWPQLDNKIPALLRASINIGPQSCIQELTAKTSEKEKKMELKSEWETKTTDDNHVHYQLLRSYPLPLQPDVEYILPVEQNHIPLSFIITKQNESPIN
jgi:hypothetical protein